jgi:type II secretory pathway component GspD/PulD (secretin)
VTLVADNTVQGTVSIDLKDVPLERALAVITQAGGFAVAKMDGYYLVGAPEPTNPNFYLLSRTEVVQLRNVRPEVILSLLSVPYGRYLSSEGSTPVPTVRGSDASDLRRSIGSGFGGSSQRNQNSGTSADVALPAPTFKIAITAPPSLIERIKADITRLDEQRGQVMLEALVLEISQDDIKNLGFNLATRYLQFSTAGNNSGSNFAYSSITNNELVQISALVQNGRARVRANPRVTTGDGQTAEVEVGRENYFTIVTGTTGFAYNTLEVIRSGISLRITPRILDGVAGTEGSAGAPEVSALVEPEVRDVTGRGQNGLPEITFRRAATNVRVKNGESIVIGGLINEFDSTSNSKIPILGDLPLIGKVFRGTSTRRLRTETVIIITPRVLRGDAVRDGIQSPDIQSQMQRYREDNRRTPLVPSGDRVGEQRLSAPALPRVPAALPTPLKPPAK